MTASKLTDCARLVQALHTCCKWAAKIPAEEDKRGTYPSS